MSFHPSLAGTPPTHDLEGGAKSRPPPIIPDHALIRVIGSGSYGQVWLARNVMGTCRAVKIVYRDAFADTHPFEREYNGIQKFEPVSRTHPGLIDILQIGRNDSEGYFYYVMELADDEASGPEVNTESYHARTIRSEIRRRGRLSFQDCLQLSLALTDALNHLHRHGLVHRDIKPSNIIFVNGLPELADIGLVTDSHDAKSYVGTEGFIPPEGPGTPQADIYSLGKVLYEISTGKDRQNYPEPPTLLEGFPDREQLLELNEVVLKACENDPSRRYTSAAQMHSDLALLQSGKSVRHLHRIERRLKILNRGALATVAIVLLGVVPYSLAIREARTSRALAKKETEQRERADQETLRAHRAEANAREKLWDSYLAYAQARRWSHRVGQRFDSLDSLRKAAAIRPSLELRNEAIACLTLPDLRLTRELDCEPTPLLAVDRPGDTYATEGANGDVHIRSTKDNKEVALLPGFGPAVHDLQFSPSGRLMAVSYAISDRHGLRIWDVNKREVVMVPPVKHYRSIAFSADETLAAIAQIGGPLLIYDLRAGQTLRSFPQEHLLWTVSFDPSGSRLAISSAESPVVKILNVETGELIRSFSHPDGVLGLAWSPDGAALAAGGVNRRIYIWDTRTGQERTTLIGHQAAVIVLQFNHTGNLVASVGWDSHLRLWNAITGSEIFNRRSYIGGTSFSADDNRVFLMTGQGKFGVFEFASGAECRLLPFDQGLSRASGSITFSPDGEVLLTGHRNGVQFWSVDDGRQLGFWDIGDTRAAHFARAGESLITNGPDGFWRWALDPSPQLAAGNLTYGPAEDLGWRTDQPTSLDRDGRFAAAVRDGKACVFDLTTRREIRVLTGGLPFEFAALSGDAKWCAAGQWKASAVRLFEVESGTTKAELPAERVSAASFSPDARWMVTGGFDDYSCWTGEPWRLVWRHRRDATGYLHPAMAFSPDSRMVAVGDSQVVRLFDVATGRPLATLESREPSLTAALAFNHDGTRLAVSGWDRFIQLWDLRRVREALAEMRLDWELPPFPPAASTEDHALAVAKQLSSSDRPKPTAAAQVSSPGPSK